MKLKALTELTWRLYQNGRAYANNQHVIKDDIAMKCKLEFSKLIRQMYYESMATDEFRRPDYSFTSPLLESKSFQLTDIQENKYRRCDMSEWDLYRMPKNSHFTNIYPVGSCRNDEVGEITQVAPAEENFYINDPELKEFIFYVVKGKGLNFYNLPLCVKSVIVEATYEIGNETEVDMGLGSMIVDQILGVVLGIKKQYYSEEAQKEMNDQNVVK
jgi:hypothetical protein